jgi:hypothetical protein
MSPWEIAAAVFFASFVTTILGFALGYHRGRHHGFDDGERFGVSEGYRQAWLKRHRPLFSAKTQDWHDACDE